jgi:hypothetical protein
LSAVISPAGVTSHDAIVTREYASTPDFPDELVIIGHTDVSQLNSGDIMSIDIQSEAAQLDVWRYGPISTSSEPE